MADISDVENALKALIGIWCYPGGTGQPSAAGAPVKVGRGWPIRDALAADLAAGVVNVSIYTQPGSERLTSRFPREWIELGNGKLIRELRRQQRLFQITVWAATPEQRDAVSGFVDAKFAGAGQPNGLEFINFPDGSSGRLLYVRSVEIDRDLQGSFRRDLIYSVEYPTTETMQGVVIRQTVVDIIPQPSGPIFTMKTGRLTQG